MWENEEIENASQNDIFSKHDFIHKFLVAIMFKSDISMCWGFSKTRGYYQKIKILE